MKDGRTCHESELWKVQNRPVQRPHAGVVEVLQEPFRRWIFARSIGSLGVLGKYAHTSSVIVRVTTIGE